MERKYIIGLDFMRTKTTAWIMPIVSGAGVSADGERLKLRDKDDYNGICSAVYPKDDNGYTLESIPGVTSISNMKDRVSALRNNSEFMSAYKAYIKLIVTSLIQRYNRPR